MTTCRCVHPAERHGPMGCADCICKAWQKHDYSKPLLVGEANPYGADPRYALFPHPRQSAGYRLARLVMAMPSRDAYLEAFERANLCPQKWSSPVARENARGILATPRKRVVLLGTKVAAAFGVATAPFTLHVVGLENETVRFDPERVTPDQRVLVVLPHPSGLCRVWNEPGAFERARATLREAGVL